MKIEGTNKGLPTPQTSDKPNPPASKTPPAAGASGGDKVELSPLSSSLAKAEAAMASTPAVDSARVDEIRQAISEGRFRVDPERIADGLIESVREMLGSAR